MPAIKLNNNAYSSLAAGLTNVATTLTVATGHGGRFPVVSAGDWFMLTLQDSANNVEILKVTARAAGADSMTIERAQEGTTARAWAIGDVVEMRLTAGIVALVDATQTLTNKTINLGSNTLVMTLAQLNAAISDADVPNAADVPLTSSVVLLTGDQTIAGSKTFSDPLTMTGAAQTIRVTTDLDTAGTAYLSFQDNSTGAYVERGWVGFGEGNGNFGMSNPISGKPIKLFTSGGSLTLASNGDITASGNVTAYSDARLKTDLNQIFGAVQKIKQLTGYTFTRTDTGERQTGLIAQDVQRVLPEAVVDGGEHLALAYGNLMGLMVEAVKELSAKVEALEAR